MDDAAGKLVLEGFEEAKPLQRLSSWQFASKIMDRVTG
jgi:hypothetical protein